MEEQSIYHIHEENLIARLVKLYKTDPCGVAKACDETLDKSGKLLSEIKNRYRKLLFK